MALLVYGCRFDVQGEYAWATIVQPRYEHWISDRYRRAFQATVAVDLSNGNTSGVLPDGHFLGVRRHELDGIATELEWSFPGEQGLIWRNLVRTAQVGDRCAVEHRVEIASSEYLVAPAGYSVGAPAVVRDICQQDVLVGEMTVRASVYPLPQEGVDSFVQLLGTDLRRLPIVLLTPFANGMPCDLDAHSLADHLAGVAIVTEADTPDTTRALSEALGKLGCYDGGVRVYWPGFQKSDDLRRHPLLLGSKIASLGPEFAAKEVERSIFSVAAFRFAPDARINSIIGRSESVARAERAKEAVETGDASWEKYALEISEKLDFALVELEAFKSENANLRANQQVFFAFSEKEETDGGNDKESSIVREPKSVYEAVIFACEDCKNLVFLDTTYSVAKSSPFKRPKEIYDAMMTMDEVAGKWGYNQGQGDLRQMLKDAGLGKRVSNFISQTTKGKWGSEYTFTYEGVSRLFEWHITLGSGAANTCASIHFLPDPEIGKLVIAHVGQHLPNTKT